MKQGRMIFLSAVLVVCGSVVTRASGAADRADAGAPFGAQKLVQEIDCGVDKPGAEFPAGVSSVEKLLGANCRVLPNKDGGAKYFAYRVGQGKNLKPGCGYVLSVEFPDDSPRGFQILNWGCETARGVATGTAVGDALQGRYVNQNPESLHYPQSGKMLNWHSLFFLHDRFPDLKRPRNPAERSFVPADGFWVIIAQFPAINDPLSAGAAVSKIRLFEVDDPAKYALKVNFPPEGLPRRKILWREEMADGVIAMGHKPEEKDPKRRGVANIVDWYEYKARLMTVLGISTFCKDLLEFGHNQGWDSAEGGGNEWFYQAPVPSLWADILTMLQKYPVDVLPYYEYVGSVGGKGLGNQGRCRTLAGKQEYTQISWTEKRNVDVADPEFLPDAKKLLDLTIAKFKDKKKFAGAWFRPRPSAWPVSFNDFDLKTFGTEANGGAAPTRDQLKADKNLIEKYYAWWFGKRRAFLSSLRDHLRTKVNPDAVILFTADTSEPGISLPAELTGAGQKDGWKFKTAVVNDSVSPWADILKNPAYKSVQSVDYKRVMEGEMYSQALQRFSGTWGGWEWQHACPPADPERYKDVAGVLMTYSFNRLYTVSSSKGFDHYRNPAGLAAVRHYSLNENEMYTGAKQEDVLGYFVSDVERAGPYCMLAEARAVANGDPTILGYLMANSYARGFPEYVRAFNAAFLALPALASTLVPAASPDPEVVVRIIKTPKDGTYLAVVNTGFASKAGVAITLPARGNLTDAATGMALAAAGGKLTLTMYPGELRALRIQ